jgi:hypothetical protein
MPAYTLKRQRLPLRNRTAIEHCFAENGPPGLRLESSSVPDFDEPGSLSFGPAGLLFAQREEKRIGHAVLGFLH